MDKILDILHQSGAILDGHFLLTSGLHSPKYIEKFRALEHPQYVEKIFDAMAKPFEKDNVDIVVGPAIGGIILAYGVAKRLGCRYAFLERVKGKLVLRRDFNIYCSQRVLLVEDVVTKGTSVKEMMEALDHDNFAGLSCMVERGKLDFGLRKQESLVKLNFPTYEPKKCPLCKKGVPLTKRGSR